MDALCTFKIKIEAQIGVLGVSKTSDHIKINIKMPKPSQEPPASSKAPDEDLKDMVVLCTFKIKRESSHLEHGCSLHLQNQGREPKFGSWMYQRPVTLSKSRSKCQTPVRNLQHPPKPQMRTNRHGCSLQLQHQDREPKLEAFV